MKQLFSLILILALGFNSYAQTPVQTNKSLLIESSAAWCGPCGQNGAPFYEAMISDPYSSNKTIFVSMHPSWYTAKDSNSENYTLFSKVCDDWATEVDPWGFFPTFSLNFIDHSVMYTYGTEIYNALMSARDSFSAIATVASTGFTFKRTGNTISVTTRTKFWQNASGDYYVGAYILEDSVVHEQTAYGGVPLGIDTMRYVMRASMDGNSWGDEIVNGSVKAWQFFNKSFTYTVTDPTWDVTKLKVIVVLFQKTGGTYTYVNANEVATATSPDPTYVPTTQSNINTVSVYPNPATDKANIKIIVSNATAGTISITDAIGHVVYNSDKQNFEAGTSVHAISISGFAPGNYIVSVNTEEGNAAQPLTITR